jgi:hypothetical protein
MASSFYGSERLLLKLRLQSAVRYITNALASARVRWPTPA